MRKWVSVVALLAALTAVGIAEADTPPDVYSDYAEDGVLSCGHSRAALKGVLNDAGIHQYGDPLTLIGLKLAIRQQLAGGCRREEQAALPIGSASGDGEGPPAASGGEGAASAGAKEPSATSKPAAPPENPSTSSGDERADALAEDALSSGQDGWMLLLGVVLLLLTLGSGGWAARRVFND